MALFDLTTGTLKPIPISTFAAEGVLERTHLQRALREDIALLGDDLLVVAEEFGDFTAGHRRIDLLCVDHDARLVVVELKRTDDGGHMELQALRYAAMVSTMTLDDLVAIYDRHIQLHNVDDSTDARGNLMAWFEEEDDSEPVISREVRIILVSAGFDKEITTTCLWLNDIFGTDIRCVKLSPYRIEGRLLLDVQQVIPLPEAEELTVRLRRRQSAARAAATSSLRDLTHYVITTPSTVTEALPKRRAVLALIEALHEAGISMATIAAAVPKSKLRSVAGHLDGDAVLPAFIAHDPRLVGNDNRWFSDRPIHENGTTWMVSKMWGTQTVGALEALIALAPQPGYSFAPADS